MNVYQKLAKVRVDLQNMDLKKTGKNQSMTYFELGDFLIHINALCSKNGLMTKFSIITDKDAEKAILTVYNTEEAQEKITFTTPTADAQLPRGQEIQNLGAKITYLRRYLMMMAFEIVESEFVDAVNMQVTEAVSGEDMQMVNGAETPEQLTKVYKELEKRYKKSVLVPVFQKRQNEINPDKEVKK